MGVRAVDPRRRHRHRRVGRAVDARALLWHQPLTDAANGRTYETKNTPAVAGARAYLSTEAHGIDSDGRLVAIDVCDASDCGVRGKSTLAWHYDFRGPSGASPLLVGKRLFFDGSAPSRQGVLMAVDDLGAAPPSSAATGKARWLYRMGDNLGTNAALGQFPEVITPSGGRRVVVQGRKAGTFFIGEP